MFTGMKCLQSGTVSSYFFPLLLGYVLWVGAGVLGAGYVWVDMLPGQLLAQRGWAELLIPPELQGDLI